jgi:EmrB/QacA subfamily drug resistance transporter
MSDLTETVGAPEPEVATSERQEHLGWALVLICIAQLMVVLDATIANIALPYIGKDLHMSGTNLTWIVTGYALAFGGLLLLGGRLGDLYGRRRIFMTGLAIFAVASLLGGLAQSEALLLGARGLQGLGAALASPAALALITTTFPAGPPRNRAFAVYAAMSGAGAAVGLILGGWLTGLDVHLFNAQDGWRLTFLINVPIGLVAALLAPRFLRESASRPGHLDVPGALTGTGGLLALVYGLTRAGNAAYGWSDALTVASLLAGAILLVVFFMVEFRVEHPLLPFRIFMNRTRAASFVAMMLLPAAMFSMFFFLSLFIQNVMGYSPLKAGFAFLPFSICIIISATIVSNLANRIDPRYIAGVGTLMASAALFGFSRLSVPDSGSDVLSAVGQGSYLGSDVSYWTQILPTCA